MSTNFEKCADNDLKIILSLGDSFIVDLIPLFVEDKQKDLEETKKSLLADDYQEVSEFAHRLSGAAGSYKLQTLYFLAIELETYSKKLNRKKVNVLIESIEIFLNRLYRIVS